jgi:GNAT superfamily N-acetyltransferase
MIDFKLRAAEPRDVPALVGLIGELADFEQLSHLLRLTADTLAPHLFGERPVVEAVVAEVRDDADHVEAGGAMGGAVEGAADGVPRSGHRVVAFALYFTNFSTFLAQPGLYLEDLYVQPACRGAGIGKALLSHLGALAVVRGYGRFEWSVLDWNENAIRFYEKMGATVMPEWRICRVTGASLQAFAARDTQD